VAVRVFTGHRQMLDLTVDHLHTYYVMARNTPVLVHNCGEDVSFGGKQLQKKFKHASDFDVSGNYNPANAQKFQDALQAHLSDADTIQLRGTYRGNSARFYYNIQSQNVVVTNPGGSFVSGWRLSPGQQDNLLMRGQLGGG
jgi:hypothetical protein